MKPEEALERARTAAAARGVTDAEVPFPAPTERVTRERLLEFSLIEPDVSLVYSTRRLGAPITWIKRSLIWVLRQYMGQVLAQQTRFNIHVVAYLTQLEERVEKLERER